MKGIILLFLLMFFFATFQAQDTPPVYPSCAIRLANFSGLSCAPLGGYCDDEALMYLFLIFNSKFSILLPFPLFLFSIDLKRCTNSYCNTPQNANNGTCFPYVPTGGPCNSSDQCVSLHISVFIT